MSIEVGIEVIWRRVGWQDAEYIRARVEKVMPLTIKLKGIRDRVYHRDVIPFGEVAWSMLKASEAAVNDANTVVGAARKFDSDLWREEVDAAAFVTEGTR